MKDCTTRGARPVVAVGYGPGINDFTGHIVAVIGSTADEEQLQAAYRLLQQQVTVTYTNERF